MANTSPVSQNASGVAVTLDSQRTPHEPGQPGHEEGLGLSRRIVISQKNELLAAQVQAFLEASEDIDVDAETVEDILSVLTDEDEDENEEPPSESNLDEDEEPHDEDSEEISVPFPGADDDLAQQRGEMWTKQEVKEMLHHLKERGAAAFVEEYVKTRNIPIPTLLEAFGIKLVPELQNRRPQTMLYFLRVAMSHLLRRREKLPQYNTIQDAVDLIKKSQRILILTGAGISVSCGIPDFRSRDGLYASLKNKGDYDLDDPQQMFDIHYFRENPSVFYKWADANQQRHYLELSRLSSSFASQIYPSNFVPSPCHRFIKLVEDKGKLLRNYTQNIDTLETLAGVKKVLQCHGSFATATCLQCRTRVPGTDIEAEILSRRVPLCKVCNSGDSATVKPKGKTSKKKAKGQWDSDVEDESDAPEFPPGIMKPDITFFGEKLTDEFDRSLEEDRWKLDLLLVIGTSLKVSPVAEIVSHLPHSVPQILINKTPIRHINPDIMLLGNADNIIMHLCKELEWDLPPARVPEPSASATLPGMRLQPPRGNNNLKKRPSSSDEDLSGTRPPERVGDSHVWLFEGAEGGKWLQQLKKELGISQSTPPSVPHSGYNTRSSTPQVTPSKDAAGQREVKKQRVA